MEDYSNDVAVGAEVPVAGGAQPATDDPRIEDRRVEDRGVEEARHLDADAILDTIVPGSIEITLQPAFGNVAIQPDGSRRGLNHATRGDAHDSG